MIKIETNDYQIGLTLLLFVLPFREQGYNRISKCLKLKRGLNTNSGGMNRNSHRSIQFYSYKEIKIKVTTFKKNSK